MQTAPPSSPPPASLSSFFTVKSSKVSANRIKSNCTRIGGKPTICTKFCSVTNLIRDFDPSNGRKIPFQIKADKNLKICYSVTADAHCTQCSRPLCPAQMTGGDGDCKAEQPEFYQTIISQNTQMHNLTDG